MMAKQNPNAKIKRVWIDSQTEEEIQRGIREAKDESEYNSLSDSAYLRAKEDYLIRNKFFKIINNYLWKKSCKSNSRRKSINCSWKSNDMRFRYGSFERKGNKKFC